MLEFIILTDQLINYNFTEHVASDIGINQLYLPPEAYNMQDKLEDISNWTEDNLMTLNESKSNFIIYTNTRSTKIYYKISYEWCYSRENDSN